VLAETSDVSVYLTKV